jgi:nitrous oxidase accessory protein
LLVQKLALFILFIFLTASLIHVGLELVSFGVDESIIRVPKDYPTIQAAVNAASSGDTILVASGVYYENVVVNKPVKIVGGDCLSTVVEGAGDFSNTIHVTSDYVEISGLTVRKGGAGIFLNGSNHCSIHGNILTMNTYFGGIVLSYSNENTVAYNTALNNGGGAPPLQYGVGIVISHCNHNAISSNTVTGNVAGSLIIHDSHHNIITNNSVFEDASGIILTFSTWNIVIANNVSNTESAGIGLDYSSNNTIEDNWLLGNWEGIALGYSRMNLIKANMMLNSSDVGLCISDASPNNLVTDNTVSNNRIGVEIKFTNNSIFYHNNFINNVNNHPQDEEPFFNFNFWNNSFGEGNYWSNYTGTDANYDGIGDTPHVLYAGNQDYYPLMKPYIEGDCNHDGIVNIGDATMVGWAWNTTKGTQSYNPHVDLNMDETINTADAEIIRKNWLKHT